MKEFRVEEELGPVTLEQFFEMFFEGESFTRLYHEKCGHTDVHLGPWTKAPDGNRKQRLIRFVPPPAPHPMLQRLINNARFKEVQYYSVTPEGEAIITAATMGEVGPSVDLETRVEWTAKRSEDGTLHCTITGRDQYKRKLFKEMIEGAMRESTESSIGMWVECVRRHLHHMGFTTSPYSPSQSQPSHPSSSSELEEGEESDGGEEGQHKKEGKLPALAEDTNEEDSNDSDTDDDDDDDDRFMDAREVIHYGQGIPPTEEIAVLRATVTSLEREVTSMERQLSRAFTRIAGLQQTIQEITGDSETLSLTLPSLHQRLAALEHAQASALLVQQSSAASTPLSLSTDGIAVPPTAEELEQAAREVEMERRVPRRNVRRHRTSLINRSAGSTRENVNGNSSDSTGASHADSAEGSASAPVKKKDPRRKLMWAGVATLVVLSISLALPLLAPRASLFDRLLRPLRSYWPLSLSLSRISQGSVQGASGK